MKLVTFEPAAGCERLGILLGEKVVDLALGSRDYLGPERDSILALPTDMLSFLNMGEPAITAAGQVASWAKPLIKEKGRVVTASGDCISYDLNAVRLRAPVLRPPKIFCLALSYKAHAGEANAAVPIKPYVFIKPGFLPVVGTNAKVLRPPQSQNFCFEGELGVVIGKRCKLVPKDRAYDMIAGYTVVNDMSCRDLLKTNIPGLIDWFQGKAFDTSLPMGPCLTLKDEIDNPHDLHLLVRLNGEIVQDSSTNMMVYTIPEIIEFISSFVTIEPGDVIATGTPGGSRSVKHGDNIEVEISKIGILTSTISDMNIS